MRQLLTELQEFVVWFIRRVDSDNGHYITKRKAFARQLVGKVTEKERAKGFF